MKIIIKEKVFNLLLLIILAAFAAFFNSCDKGTKNGQTKVGMFVYGDGYSDAGWRENCKKGVMMAFDEYSIDTLFLSATSNIKETMDIFPAEGVDLLILGGMVAEA
jgi:basic membrane lipoprotein Med (substrate-binding protein (PBP1-ABC) superfamily)